MVSVRPVAQAAKAGFVSWGLLVDGDRRDVGGYIPAISGAHASRTFL